MAETIWDIGDGVILQGTFTNRSDTNTDPTQVTIEVEAPDATLTSEAGTVAVPGNLTNPSVGVWEYVFSPTQAGRHHWRATGSASPEASAPGSFVVRVKRAVFVA